jgi:tRNA threonylcarbamoyl adenosine modification protein YeaZ
MLILFIDLASSAKSFALTDAKKTLSMLPINDQKQEEILMETIESMLKQIGKNLSDLTHIACVLGPGGFTSLRIAAAMANALSFALHIPSVGMRLADLYAAQMETKDFIWIHTTRKTHLFVQGFGIHKKIWTEPTLMKLDEVVTSLPHDAHIVGELIPEHRERIHLHAPHHSLEQALPSFLSHLDYKKDQNLMPWYGREA